jgi:hypothetical protein
LDNRLDVDVVPMKNNEEIMRIRRFVSLTVFGLVPLLLGANAQKPKPFRLSIRPLQASVRAGSEVRIEVTLRNVSGRQIAMPKSDEGGDYLVEVRDGKGRMARDTELGRKLKDPGTVRVSSAPLYPLKPQESLKDEIAVGKLYEVSNPGEYTISVARPIPEELGTGVVKSNTITVTVKP